MSNILMHREGTVGVITMDRPGRFNALDVETARDLRRAGLSLCRDEEVRAVVLRGGDGVFCSGADLKYIASMGQEQDLRYLSPNGRDIPQSHGAVFKEILEYIHSTIVEIRRAPKPVIAAIDGIAAAGGLGLALACDVVIASTRSTFEYAYFRTGLTGAESATYFLPRLVGLRKALDLAFLNRRISAEEALQMGLISEVVAVEDFNDHIAQTARAFADGPTRAMGDVKQLMNASTGIERLDQHLDRELETLVDAADRADFNEGLQAFIEKRAPQFSGK